MDTLANDKTDIEKGLGTEEAKRRLAVYGYNEVPEKKTHFLITLARCFWGIVPWMLEATAFLTWFLGKYPDTIIIVALLLSNAVISIMRQRKASVAMAALKQRLSIQSRVKRDGMWSVIPARELVPGDLIRVRAGDILPADIKIVGGNTDVDQSVLTGESATVEKSSGEPVYSGSTVKRGEATGIVDATGTRTYFGKTVELVDLAKPKLHMEALTVKIARRLAIIIIISLLIAFTYALLTGFQFVVLLPLAVVLLVSAVPVAMPTMLTLNMVLGSSVLAKKGVLVTRLSASEDAAVMDVICVDKTGTMTMNKLFVEEEFPVSEFGKNDVILYGALASNEANQDPIDLAFLAAAKDTNISLDGYSQTEFVPFDPQTRMTGSTVHRSGEKFHVMKGSFKAICAYCKMTDDNTISLSKDADALSAKGLRVIAVAKENHEHGFELVGLAGVADRIRQDSRETVLQLNDLGVSVKMLTGDALPIAKNIAPQIGLGDNIIRMPDVQNQNLSGSMIEESSGMAEIYPEDKYTIVKNLQSRGHIVGMTGDGVNDAPALKQAEVGIAVRNATDIAKDSASAVLVTEGLGGILAIIKTGRTIYQRIFSWVLNMVTKKTFMVGYIVSMLFLTHSLVISIFSMVLLIFFADFATMSISTDNVRHSKSPDSLDTSWLFKVGIPLAMLTVIEGVVLTMVGMNYFKLSDNSHRLYTFTFSYLVIESLFSLMIIRERGHFWKSRPSNILLITTASEIAIVSAISILGFWELGPLGYIPLLVILAYSFAVRFPNDLLKVYLVRRFYKSSQ
ncbi:plasma-membrane proton-efflux P-type ATPase [Candidatus Nitrosotalea okcheonensis]|uniref:Putative plasma-membrane proton-efflux P-type ATPase n=1 Tax=Candidatus Nitrosotalea okcheonensis TaxID=1903276 RepID=A0A2H1FEL5_9ARCH|nr:plasma-membrane proton-efflux P-type ATPase [Candidatus Nitrosotalea okcheonensis]SMH71203.1 putative plasma-membrane proton-efflux P-type ATPase [Candidatus Nitrosotalea okcheonensis]